MRKTFNRNLLEIAKRNERIFLVVSDIGYGEIEPFAHTFPDRFFNVGVAEQNMTGIACGLALEGNIAITYSIANFPTLRCLEQIRNDVCYHNANVKIVIIGGGVAYGALGISHHSTEDLAIMRALPNMVVLSPCDCIEAKEATLAMIEHQGPVYYRCGYKGEPDIHSGPINFEIGRAIQICDGNDGTIIFTGTIGYNVLLAREILSQKGIKCRLISMHTIKPIDTEIILLCARETGAIITVEEHNLSGGLGGAISEVLAGNCLSQIKFKRIAFPDIYVSEVGSQEWLREKYGMSPSGIAKTIEETIRGN